MKTKLLIPAMITAFILGLLVTEIVCKPEVIVKKKVLRQKNAISKPLPLSVTYLETIHIKELLTDTVYNEIVKFDTVIYYINDYLATYYYQDTLKIDTLGYVCVKDSINRNKIKHRSYDYEVNQYTKYVNKNNFSVSAGLFLLNSNKLYSIGGTFDITHKKNVFGGSIGTNQAYLLNYKRIVFER